MQSPLSDAEHSRPPLTTFGPLSSRCTQCNAQQKENTRNLVVCIDGASSKNTNVGKLFASINRRETTRPEQLACDPTGSETRKRPKSLLKRMERAVCDKLDIAGDMKEIVKDAYDWLARTYQEGDQIYLFGFSRGAFQVRVLAGMIHEVGLMKSRTPTEKQIAMAYDYFEAIRSGKPKTRQIAREFKNKSSWKDLRVHFVGVWDSVSSVGTIRADDFLSTFQSSASHVCHFRHALALDERRVELIPDYICQMNTRTDDVKSKYIVTIPDVDHVASPANEGRESTASDVETDDSEGKKARTTEIKEVWFAGSHSDVGGRDVPGRFYQAGNVSLLWMRREAAASGLVLEPTDIVWLPSDLEFGTSSAGRGFSEYLPIMQQVSFSGSGEHAKRLHRLQPRRIIPGQKVHASILHASVYKPQASLGEGFNILDMEPDNEIWETGLFDDTAAHELVTSLGGQKEVPPIHIDRLLFMIRFEEGRQCVRNLRNQLKSVILERDCATLIRLVAIVAYFATSCDPETPISSASPDVELPQDIFDDAKKSFCDILAAHNGRDGPRVVALLRCLINHKILREQILTHDVLEALVRFFDVFIYRRTENFGQAMDGLNCLLQCEDMQKTIIEKLGENSRLLRMLKVNSSDSLAAALRMVVTLSRIPEAKPLCSATQPRIRELAGKDKRGVGLLAVEILLALYDRNDELNIRDARALASALVHLNPDRHDLAEQILRHLLGHDVKQLNQLQINLIGELRGTVQKGDARKRTAATLTLLKLCENPIIRTHLSTINMLDDFINQLQRKDTALLAAYALAACLEYDDMKDMMKGSMTKDDAELPKNIVGMLRLDYFDDAIGQVEGFQIFGNLMQHVELRERIMTPEITEILSAKLAKGKSKETRTSLICLDIFRSFERDGPWTSELIDESLKSLRKPEWKAQKAGVTVLSALAQTKHGVAAIGPRIYEIVEMLLPEGYVPVRPTTTGVPASQTPPTNSGSSDAPSARRMMGPACALRMLAQNKVLRERTRKTMQYDSLKQLYLSGMLVGRLSTDPWEVETPRPSEINMILNKVIEVVDDELSEEGFMSIGDAVLPYIRHWDEFHYFSMAIVPMLPVVLCYVPIAFALGAAGAAISFSFGAVFGPFVLLWFWFEDSDLLDWLRGHPWSEREGEFGPDVHDAEGGSSGHGGEGSPSGQRGEGSQGDDKVGAQDGGEVESLTTSP